MLGSHRCTQYSHSCIATFWSDRKQFHYEIIFIKPKNAFADIDCDTLQNVHFITSKIWQDCKLASKLKALNCNIVNTDFRSEKLISPNSPNLMVIHKSLLKNTEFTWKFQGFFSVSPDLASSSPLECIM